jgi:hypothetical protein
VIANEELRFQSSEKDKRAAELVIANEEKDKRADELVTANQDRDKRAAELVTANEELIFQNEEKQLLLRELKRAASVIIIPS